MLLEAISNFILFPVESQAPFQGAAPPAATTGHQAEMVKLK